MTTVFANGRSVVHLGDGQKNVCGVPDVCKTPMPGGPVPVPYVNVAASNDLVEGSQSVRIEGKSIALASSGLATSTGDEAGADGGIISCKIRGKTGWASASLDVKVEGKGAVRFMDVVLQNGNRYNSHATEGFANLLINALRAAHDAWKVADCDRSKLRSIAQSGMTPTAKLAEAAKVMMLRPNPLPATIDEWMEFLVRETTVVHPKVVKDEKPRESFMVGAMVCEAHSSTVSVAMSGRCTEGFRVTVNRLNAQQSAGRKGGGGFVWEVVRGPLDEKNKELPVAIDDFADCNPRIKGDAEALKVLKARWASAVADFDGYMSKETKEKGKETLKESFNPPGTCAAAKLLTRASHSPFFLTEKLFSPARRSSENVSGVYEFKGQTVAKWFSDGETVPSCGTCKKLLPMALCPPRRPCKATADEH